MPRGSQVAGCRPGAGARCGCGHHAQAAIATEHTVIYEAHVKGLTRLHPGVPDRLRGTYAGLASAAMLAHYKKLGITTLCLLPVQHHIDEKHLLELGLTNYWGYNTLGYFVPEPRYSASATPEAVRDEFRAMVDQLHQHGLEVVLDVVYNHTAEGDARGPTLCWRGLDNASSYCAGRLRPVPRLHRLRQLRESGEPRMVQFVMDSLRWWVQAFGVDGFRFDLATTLGRDPALHHRFNPARRCSRPSRRTLSSHRSSALPNPGTLGRGATSLAASRPGGRNGTTASATPHVPIGWGTTAPGETSRGA